MRPICSGTWRREPTVCRRYRGLPRALARRPNGESFPEYEAALLSAARIVVPGLVLAEVDDFLRRDRSAMRALVAEIFDPRTRYEYEPPLPADLARALFLDAKCADLNLGIVDGTVAALAERRRIGRILTSDRRDFSVGQSWIAGWNWCREPL